MQTWQETIVAAQVAGSALSNSTTATSLLPTHAKIVLPSNFFNAAGKALRVKIAGQISNIVTTPGTLTLDFRLGSVVAFNGGAMQLSSTAHTTVPFIAEILLTCRSVGSGTSATLMGQGAITSQALSLTAVADSTTTPATLLLPNTTPAAGTGFDSTASQQIDVFGTFSIANAGNAITIQQFIVESLN
jgi:hypothetical protein